ncbi:hypothetical protein ABT392_07925 [Paucibacter sp. JuS9]|uniref:hypothetical protein n=1 Tax=Paucibacter sp. JuS9 TaxID=3228748 RepID=UPI0037583FF0
MSASIQFHRIDEYFDWPAPVQATVAFRVNIADVIKISVRREPLAGYAIQLFPHRLHVFPRNDESDDPLGYMWLIVSMYRVYALAMALYNQIREYLYVRYGGRTPPRRVADRHVLEQLSRPVTGTIEIDIQTDERLHFEALLANGATFHASAEGRLPAESHRARLSPHTAVDSLKLLSVALKSTESIIDVTQSLPSVRPSAELTASTPGLTDDIALLNHDAARLAASAKLLDAPTLKRVRRKRIPIKLYWRLINNRSYWRFLHG